VKYWKVYFDQKQSVWFWGDLVRTESRIGALIAREALANKSMTTE